MGVDMGSRIPFALEGRIDNTGSPCRSADIQSLESLFPWVTLLDVEIYLLGRMTGEACPGRTEGSCNLEHAELPRLFSRRDSMSAGRTPANFVSGGGRASA